MLPLGRIAYTQCKYAASCYRYRVVCVSVCLAVCLSVCLSVGHSREPSKTDEPIDMPFTLWTRMGVRWVGGADLSLGKGTIFRVAPDWNALGCVSNKRCSSTGCRLIRREQRMTASARSQNGLTRRGWQVRGRCGLSSKFFDHLSVVVVVIGYSDLQPVSPGIVPPFLLKERNIVMSVSVCLSVCPQACLWKYIMQSSPDFCTCYLVRLRLSHPLVALR